MLNKPIKRDEIFKNVKNPIIIIDTHDRILDYNHAFKEIFHINSSIIIGKKFNDIFSKFENFKHIIANKNEFRDEIPIYISGKIVYFDVQLTNLYKKENRLIARIIDLRDISYRKKTELALKESEDKFRKLTEFSPIAIMIYQDNKWVYANPSAEKITGYNKDEILSIKQLDFIHTDFKEKIEHLGFTIKNNISTSEFDQLKIISKNSNEKWIEYKTRDIEFNGKKAVLFSALDISKRKKTDEILQQQLAAVKTSSDGIAISNEKDKFTYFNQAFLKLFGYDNQNELIGKKWYLLYDAKEKEKIDKEILPTLFKNGKWLGESVGKKRDGIKFDQEISITLLNNKSKVFVIRDTTKRNMVLNELKDAHELLYTVNKQLERKVEDRTSEIEKLLKQKDEFVDQLGHDLKTPLTPLIALIPIIRKKLKDSKSQELMDVITRNVYFMKELVDKTVELARLNSTRIDFTFQDTNLYNEAENALKSCQIILEKNNISIENNIDSYIKVQADKLRLEELFNNLISNAIKYSKDEGGIIRLNAEDDKNFIKISVNDTGKGMNKEQISQIFDEFYKADESRHNLDSSGLGLAISKRIVEKLGGKIWAESPGFEKGSTFYFTLKKSIQ